MRDPHEGFRISQHHALVLLDEHIEFLALSRGQLVLIVAIHQFLKTVLRGRVELLKRNNPCVGVRRELLKQPFRQCPSSGARQPLYRRQRDL